MRLASVMSMLLGLRTVHSCLQSKMMQAPSNNLYSLTATQALNLLKNDTITAEQYAQALIDRIDERDADVRAWTYLDRDYVLSQARALDKIPASQRGPLHGVAVGIKDIMNTQDMPTQFGSRLYKGYHSNFDASPVSILRSAGAIIMGKTTTTEFTVLNCGPNTTNAHDINRTPGGSSAGSAAAVADFQVPLSFGTQNGGSVIRPASYNGIYAMKPSMNVISPEGVKLVAFTIDTVGYMARSMDDLQLVADVFAFRREQSSGTTSLKDARVGFIKSPMWSAAGAGTIAAMDNGAAILRNHGVAVEEVELPPEFGGMARLKSIHSTVLNGEGQAAFLKEYRLNKTELDPRIQAFDDGSITISSEDMVHAQDDYGELRRAFDDLAGSYSAIITPSAVDIAPLGLGDMGSSVFNFLWTGLHVPVINVPAFVGDANMPVGLSVITKRDHDQHLLAICKVLSEPLVAEGGWDINAIPRNPKL